MIRAEIHDKDNRGIERLEEHKGGGVGGALGRLGVSNMLRTAQPGKQQASMVQLRVQRVHLVLCRALHLRLGEAECGHLASLHLRDLRASGAQAVGERRHVRCVLFFRSSLHDVGVGDVAAH